MHPLFKENQHPRGPNGRFTRSFARVMSALDHRKRDKAKRDFKGHEFKGPDDARSYLSHLSGTKGPQIREHIASGGLGRATEALRAGKTDAPEVHQIDATMKPLPDGLDLYRSVPAKQFGKVDPKGLEGHLVSDAGYFPTTVAPVKAGPGNVELHVQAPAGTHAAVDPDSGKVVLDHGTPMSVESVEVGPDGSTRMNLVALPEGGGGQASPGSAPGRPDRAAPEEFVDEGDPEFEGRVEQALEGADVRSSVSHSLERRDTLTEDQYRGLSAYLGEDYQPINHILRGGSDADLAERWPDTTREDIDDWVAGVDSAMEQSRLPQEAAVYRGLNATRIFGDAFEQDMTGLEWQEDAYASTSTDPAVSREFAGRGRGATMMNVLVPQGVGAVELSGESYESELLLERGLTFRIVADRGFGDDGTRWLDVEVVPRGR